MDELKRLIPEPETSVSGNFPLEERRRRVRRQSNGVGRHHYHSRRRLVYGLWAALAILFLLLLVTAIKLSLYAKEVNDLTLLQAKQERELERLRPRLAQLERELAELVKQRLPGLYPLEFDKVIPIDKEYVQHILFTRIGKAEDRNYEFKLTLRNGDLTAVHPIVRVMFFDHLGIQVASAAVGVDDKGVPTLDVLERGEVRSYVQVISLPSGKEAKYFRIETDLPAYQKPRT
ncbi:hypothetical protein JCM13664_02390 [Methylothermus subterraneus]